MGQPREDVAHNLAERLCWQAARREDSRVARRLYRTPGVDGVYRLDAGALLDACLSGLQELGGGDWLGALEDTASQRERVPVVPSVLRYSLKPLLGIESMKALPPLLCRDEARMRLVGCKAQPARQGGCPRGAATRQGPRTTGPICPDTLAAPLVALHRRDLDALCHGVIRALAHGGVRAAKGTGIVAATARETTAPSAGCGQVPRTRQITDKRGTVHALEGTVYGWKLRVVSAARTKLPVAAKVVPIQEHETRSLRALGTPARTHLAGHARRHHVGFDQGCGAGVERWGLAPHGSLCVVPAKDNRAVTPDARAQAAAGAGMPLRRRAHTVRHGQGTTAWTERRETAVGGITGLTPSAQYGTPAHGRQHNRRDFQGHRINAVMVRKWNNRDSGPGGKTVFLPKAPVQRPLQPCDDDDERSLIENGWIKEAKPPWDLGHPPQQTGRAGRVHGLFPLLLCA